MAQKFSFDDENENIEIKSRREIHDLNKPKEDKKPLKKAQKKRKLKLKKWQIALIIILIVGIIFGGVMIYMARDNGAVYGDRCSGLVSLKQSAITQTQTEIKNKYSSISKINIETQCKEIKFDIQFQEGTSSSDATNIATEVMTLLDNNAGLSSYDGSNYSVLYNTYEKVRQFECQFYLTSTNSNDFPIYGTKLANKDEVNFTLASIKDQSTYNEVNS